MEFLLPRKSRTTRLIYDSVNKRLRIEKERKRLFIIWFTCADVAFSCGLPCSAHPNKRKVVLNLLEEGRLEIMTGGWVMTDEAAVHLYAMVDQLVEGE